MDLLALLPVSRTSPFCTSALSQACPGAGGKLCVCDLFHLKGCWCSSLLLETWSNFMAWSFRSRASHCKEVINNSLEETLKCPSYWNPIVGSTNSLRCWAFYNGLNTANLSSKLVSCLPGSHYCLFVIMLVGSYKLFQNLNHQGCSMSAPDLHSALEDVKLCLNGSNCNRVEGDFEHINRNTAFYSSKISRNS